MRVNRDRTGLGSALARLRERHQQRYRLQLETTQRDRVLRETSAEVRVASQMDVAGGAIAKGFRGVSGGLDTPTFQKPRPYTIGPDPCQCPAPPRRQVPTGKKTFVGEVLVIFVVPDPPEEMP